MTLYGCASSPEEQAELESRASNWNIYNYDFDPPINRFHSNFEEATKLYRTVLDQKKQTEKKKNKIKYKNFSIEKSDR